MRALVATLLLLLFGTVSTYHIKPGVGLRLNQWRQLKPYTYSSHAKDNIASDQLATVKQKYFFSKSHNDALKLRATSNFARYSKILPILTVFLPLKNAIAAVKQKTTASLMKTVKPPPKSIVPVQVTLMDRVWLQRWNALGVILVVGTIAATLLLPTKEEKHHQVINAPNISPRPRRPVAKRSIVSEDSKQDESVMSETPHTMTTALDIAPPTNTPAIPVPVDTKPSSSKGMVGSIFDKLFRRSNPLNLNTIQLQRSNDMHTALSPSRHVIDNEEKETLIRKRMLEDVLSLSMVNSTETTQHHFHTIVARTSSGNLTLTLLHDNDTTTTSIVSHWLDTGLLTDIDPILACEILACISTAVCVTLTDMAHHTTSNEGDKVIVLDSLTHFMGIVQSVFLHLVSSASIASDVIASSVPKVAYNGHLTLQQLETLYTTYFKHTMPKMLTSHSMEGLDSLETFFSLPAKRVESAKQRAMREMLLSGEGMRDVMGTMGDVFKGKGDGGSNMGGGMLDPSILSGLTGNSSGGAMDAAALQQMMSTLDPTKMQTILAEAMQGVKEALSSGQIGRDEIAALETAMGGQRLEEVVQSIHTSNDVDQDTKDIFNQLLDIKQGSSKR